MSRSTDVGGALVAAWLRRAAERVREERDRLTRLDAAIGDGDHGVNLDRGFAAIVTRLDAGPLPDDPGALVQEAGRLILGTVGGASGALYGRGLVRAGARLGGAPFTVSSLAEALATAAEAIAALGRSGPGEKTMLDALLPAIAALRAVERDVPVGAALAAAADAAEAGAVATIPMLATKGRASYLGERSIGHLDPGAVSSAMLVRAMAEVAADPVGGAARPAPRLTPP